MIELAFFAAALLAFGRHKWLLWHYKNFESRRRLTGCELARQVLDLKGNSQISVQAVKKGQARTGAQHLLLTECFYEGTSLLAAAVSAREAVRGAENPFWGILKVGIIPAWGAFLIGSLNPAWSFIHTAGFLLLASVVILGLIDFIRDIEIRRETLDLLKKIGGFEPDEIIKLKRLLRALQLEALSQIFKVPYDFAAGWTKKRKNSGF